MWVEQTQGLRGENHREIDGGRENEEGGAKARKMREQTRARAHTHTHTHTHTHSVKRILTTE